MAAKLRRSCDMVAIEIGHFQFPVIQICIAASAEFFLVKLQQVVQLMPL